MNFNENPVLTNGSEIENSVSSDRKPMVSILILNRNGSSHLKKLFFYFKKNTHYPNYEILVMDNASTDDSIRILEKEAKYLPVKIIKNKANVSFSKGNNILARHAKGEYILLLNNDVMPMGGWLNELVSCAMRYSNAGAIGAKLLYPDTNETVTNDLKNYKVQHAGVDIEKEENLFKPYNIAKGLNSGEPTVNKESSILAVTGAVLLVKRSLYWEVGGLDERYNYGCEDVDFCLKLIKHGFINIYCPTAVLFHTEFGTQRMEQHNTVKERRYKNLCIFNDKWSNWLEYRKNKSSTNSGGRVMKGYKIAIKIPVPYWDVAYKWGDYHMAIALKKEFEAVGCKTIIQILPEWNNEYDDDCDVVIVLRGMHKYQPKRKHFNILWHISHPDKITIEEYNSYDYVFIASSLWYNKMKKLCSVPVEVMLQCTDTELFYHYPAKKYRTELLFVGNARKEPRKILRDLLPTERELRVYGANWNEYIDKKYIFGEYIPNHKLNKAYSSCKILLNDHTEEMKKNGFISNRLFDGFASGAFIISDKVKGAEEVFGDALVTYKTPEELKHLIKMYVKNKELRREKAREGCRIVREYHTFQKRVNRFLQVIRENLN